MIAAIRNLLLFEIPPRSDERRRHGRLPCDEAPCSLGNILDISASGMCIMRKGGPWRMGPRQARVDDEFVFDLSHDGELISLRVRIVRIEKLGFRRHSYGLQFVDPTPDTRRKLTNLTRDAASTLTAA